MNRILLDTGPLVALLDRSERHHAPCVDFLRDFSGELLTTEPVITEAMYLFSEQPRFQQTCVEFVIAARVRVVPLSYERLRRAAHLMLTYSNVPMDYADATLVTVAEESGIREVFTLDRHDFEIYRLPKRQSFRIWP